MINQWLTFTPLLMNFIVVCLIVKCVFISTVSSAAGSLPGLQLVFPGVFEPHLHGHALHTGKTN